MSSTILTPAQARVTYNQMGAYGYVSVYHHHSADIEPFLAIAALQPSETLLDLGTGVGWIPLLAAARCRFALGLDVSDVLLAFARQCQAQRSVQNVVFDTADILSREHIRRAIDAVPPHLTSTASTASTASTGTTGTTGTTDTTDTTTDTTSTTTDTTSTTSTTSTAPPASSDPAASALSSPSTFMRFDVVTVCWTLTHVDPSARPAFLTMLREHVLHPSGRLVLEHGSTRADMYTIETVYSYHNHDGRLILGTWGRQKVGNRASVVFTRQELRSLATQTGWRVESVTVSPDAAALGYTDVTEEVRGLATGPAFDELERARMILFRRQEDDFRRSAEYAALARDVGNGRVASATKHKVASVVGVLRPSVGSGPGLKTDS